ncbi:MAG: LacI family DNA-binding transcriptional regulator [Anaerolineae bacterium]|nr:LacI family DNA-binding transcriptional regulator [Anaerolineae bacterium]
MTIKDVARRAGVSTGTVSNTLSGKQPVSEATRQRVLEAIEELGYHPNEVARSLVTQRSHTLGVVAMGFDYFGPSQTVTGIEREARRQGYLVTLSVVSPDDTDADEVLQALVDRRMDGIIWAVPEIGDNHAWIENGIPLELPVVFTNMERRSDVAATVVDNFAGGKTATEHLLSQGRRRIGHITGPLVWWEARERRRGWQAALRAAGLADQTTWWEEGDWSARSGREAMERLLARCPQVDAVFVQNDQMALGAITALRGRGLRVPEDVALVGFDDIPEAAYFEPPLTTIRQDLYELGRATVQTLLELIETPDARQCYISLKPQLIVRESCGGVISRAPS